ncbi:basic proline-rich protein-like [Melozone crissalis]|uniref:basic proline-rich protein-like n=1 Tax=Melozone crissalis TaxID=40204 RepID=UPI0023DA8CC9|nr:basic proline-rich protein-like [Melozone crissalis]
MPMGSRGRYGRSPCPSRCDPAAAPGQRRSPGGRGSGTAPAPCRRSRSVPGAPAGPSPAPAAARAAPPVPERLLPPAVMPVPIPARIPPRSFGPSTPGTYPSTLPAEEKAARPSSHGEYRRDRDPNPRAQIPILPERLGPRAAAAAAAPDPDLRTALRPPHPDPGAFAREPRSAPCEPRPTAAPAGTARSPGRCGGAVTVARGPSAAWVCRGSRAVPPVARRYRDRDGRSLAFLSPQSPVPVSPPRPGVTFRVPAPRAGEADREREPPAPRSRPAPSGPGPPARPRVPEQRPGPPRPGDTAAPAPPPAPGTSPGTAPGPPEPESAAGARPEPPNAALPARHPPPIGAGERPRRCPGSGKSLGRSSGSAAEPHEGAPERRSQPRSRPREAGAGPGQRRAGAPVPSARTQDSGSVPGPKMQRLASAGRKPRVGSEGREPPLTGRHRTQPICNTALSQQCHIPLSQPGLLCRLRLTERCRSRLPALPRRRSSPGSARPAGTGAVPGARAGAAAAGEDPGAPARALSSGRGSSQLRLPKDGRAPVPRQPPRLSRGQRQLWERNRSPGGRGWAAPALSPPRSLLGLRQEEEADGSAREEPALPADSAGPEGRTCSVCAP